jgi:hypothetical protein
MAYDFMLAAHARSVTKTPEQIFTRKLKQDISWLEHKITEQADLGFFTYTSHPMKGSNRLAKTIERLLDEAGYEAMFLSENIDGEVMYRYKISWA